MTDMLTTAEYNEVQARRTALQSQIDGADRDKDKFDAMKKLAKDRKDAAKAALLLYTNHLSEAVAEYEAAHLPEEPGN